MPLADAQRRHEHGGKVSHLAHAQKALVPGHVGHVDHLAFGESHAGDALAGAHAAAPGHLRPDRADEGGSSGLQLARLFVEQVQHAVLCLLDGVDGRVDDEVQQAVQVHGRNEGAADIINGLALLEVRVHVLMEARVVHGQADDAPNRREEIRLWRGWPGSGLGQEQDPRGLVAGPERDGQEPVGTHRREERRCPRFAIGLLGEPGSCRARRCLGCQDGRCLPYRSDQSFARLALRGAHGSKLKPFSCGQVGGPGLRGQGWQQPIEELAEQLGRLPVLGNDGE